MVDACDTTAAVHDGSPAVPQCERGDEGAAGQDSRAATREVESGGEGGQTHTHTPTLVRGWGGEVLLPCDVFA